MSGRFTVLCLLALCCFAPVANATAGADLDRAAQQRQVAFVLVTDAGAAGLDPARDLIRQVLPQVDQSILVELDRSDAANADLVTRYRLAGAPLPLILVAGRNGAIAGGLPAAQATAERLIALVPSPKKAEILQALQSGKAVFICASRKGMPARSTTASACASACSQTSGQCALIEVDMDDPAEIGFLTQLKVDLAATEPVTLVVNAAGQIAGTYVGAVDVAQLVQATTQKVGGCCPSTVAGGSKGCGPQQK
jgi:hypothetical protein